MDTYKHTFTVLCYASHFTYYPLSRSFIQVTESLFSNFLTKIRNTFFKILFLPHIDLQFQLEPQSKRDTLSKPEKFCRRGWTRCNTLPLYSFLSLATRLSPYLENVFNCFLGNAFEVKRRKNGDGLSEYRG